MLSFSVFVILFIWLLILHDEVRSLKDKLQKFINSSYVNQPKSPVSAVREVHESVDKEEPKVIKEITPAIISEQTSEKEAVKEERSIQPVEKGGFEKIFLGNIFNKIGALAIIIGIGFLLKVVSEFIVFTPLMRISIAALAGILMMGGSLKLDKDNMKSYAEVLMGTGVAVIFVTLYCAVSLYNMIPVSLASIFGILLVIMTWFIAEKYKSFSTFLIGFAGGYLNPFFVNTNITQNFLFGYLIFLNLISIIYVWKNESKQALNYINLFLTFFTMTIFCLIKNDTVNVSYPLTLWALYVVNHIATVCKNKDCLEKASTIPLNCMNYILLIAFAKMFNQDMFMITGLFVLGASVVYNAMLILVKTKENETVKEFSYGLVLSLLIGTYFTFSGAGRICLWAIEGAVISYAASKYKYLSNWAMAFLLAAFGGIFFVQNAVYIEDLSSYTPVFNFRLILFGIPTVCALFASYILKDNEKISDILKFMYVSLIYLFGVFEINSVYSKYSNQAVSNISVLKHLTYSIVGFIYAINGKRLAMTTKSSLFGIASGAVFAVSITVLLFNSFDFSSTGLLPVLNLRFIAYMFAIGACVYYSTKSKNTVYNYLALILGFCAVHFDVVSFTDSNNWAISVVWILYAGLVTLIGIFKDLNYMKKAGIWISILAVLKITLFDMAQLEMQYKIITYITLGIILMGVSFFYNRLKGSDS